jgi:hypothetical protein
MHLSFDAGHRKVIFPAGNDTNWKVRVPASQCRHLKRTEMAPQLVVADRLYRYEAVQAFEGALET